MNKWQIVVYALAVSFLILRLYTFYSNRTTYKNGQYLAFKTTILQEPKAFGNYQRITANLDTGEAVFITTLKDKEFNYGDTLKVSGSLEVKDSTSFSSRGDSVTSNKRIILSMFLPKIELSENDDFFNFLQTKFLLAVTSPFRQRMQNMFEGTLSLEDSGLMLGIVFGVKESLPNELKTSLQKAGVIHVVAASGMNVVMVSAFLSSLLMIFLKRQYAIILTCLGIIFYASLSSFEPSIVRASIMGILAFTASILGRQVFSLFVLFLTGWLMLVISPHLLLSVSFQLSFLSTLGLILFFPLLKVEKGTNNYLKLVLGEDVLTTFSAQVWTLPIIITNFGNYSLFSIITNALVLWIIPTLMVLGGVASIFFLVFPPLGKIFLYLSLPFLIYFKEVVNFFAKTSQLKIQEFPFAFVISYYLFLLAIVLFLKKRKKA